MSKYTSLGMIRSCIVRYKIASSEPSGSMRLNAPAAREIGITNERSLLLRQLHDRDHLLREDFRGGEALREHHDLRDEVKVGDHHRHRSDDRLEVIRQLRATGVPGVHRHEHAAGRDETDVLALEEERLRADFHRGHDDGNLRRDDGEHLHGDAVKLVEARPRARLRQPAEHLRGHLIIDAVGAVEDDDVPRERFAEILHGFRLTRARGSERIPASTREHGGAQGHVTSVRQRRHDETSVVALVLVPVREHGQHLLHDAVVRGLVPVKPKLRDPLEIGDLRAPRLPELVDRISRVHLDRDQRHHLLAVHLIELRPRHRDELREVRHPLLLQRSNRLLRRVRIRQRLFALRRPDDAAGADDALPGVFLHPLFFLHPFAVLQRRVQGLFRRRVHRGLDRVEPLLRSAVRGDLVVERNRLAVGGVHRGGAVRASAVLPGRVHLELFDPLEHAFEVRLHVHRVFRLTENLEKIVRRDEVEARELLALLLEVVLQRLLNLLELGFHVRELVQPRVRDRRPRLRVRPRARLDDVLDLCHLRHVLDERDVHGVEHFALLRELLPNVLRPDEDVLEVGPAHLHLLHEIHHLAHERELLLPARDGRLEHEEELGRFHRRQRDDVVLQRREHVVRAAKPVNHFAAFLPALAFDHVHVQVLPPLLDRRERVLDREFFRRVRRELPDEVRVLAEPEVVDLSERERVPVRIEPLPAPFHELLPVPLPNRGVPQVDDQRQRALERVHGVFDALPRAPVLHLSSELLNLLPDNLRRVF
eukprot:31229-Pelagococcus_subviridis.AAC.10